MSRPAVTALIDTYNHERFIEEAIVSVLEQDFPSADVEILVVDDGSTDGTPEIVRKFEPRVRLIRKPNGGQASAFNAGIPQARGEIIAFLDGDDWWAKTKLQIVTDTLAAHPDVGIVGHGYYEDFTSGEEGKVICAEGIYRLHLRDAQGAALFIQLKGFLGTSKLAIRKPILDRVLPIPSELKIEADEYMFTAAVAISDAIVLNQALFHYRLHEGNLFQFRSGDAQKLQNKSDVLACLWRELPKCLAPLGVRKECIDIVIEPLRIDVVRHRLSTQGGMPWDTYSIERAQYRLSYPKASAGYRVYKELMLAMTLLMPPRRFYRLREWYTVKNLRRFRNMAGDPGPTQPVIERSRMPDEEV